MNDQEKWQRFKADMGLPKEVADGCGVITVAAGLPIPEPVDYSSPKFTWSDKPPKPLKIGQCPNCLEGIEIKGQYAVKCWNCGQTCLEKFLR